MNRGLTWCRGGSPRDFGSVARAAWGARPNSDARRFEGAVAFEVAHRRPTPVRIDGDGEPVCCEVCGQPVADDLSLGRWVHDPDALGAHRADGLNEDHAGRPPKGTQPPHELTDVNADPPAAT
jgi:hypothetical protein